MSLLLLLLLLLLRAGGAQRVDAAPASARSGGDAMEPLSAFDQFLEKIPFEKLFPCCFPSERNADLCCSFGLRLTGMSVSVGGVGCHSGSRVLPAHVCARCSAEQVSTPLMWGGRDSVSDATEDRPMLRPTSRSDGHAP
eukprot:COSAG01_NODE_15399_length_1342_cov_2.227675_1_plen_139_part_00